MGNKNLEDIAGIMLTVFPLFKKKLFRQVPCQEKMELTPSHMHILLTLGEKGTMSVSEIGKILDISRPNMTPLIDKLIKEGMVDRLPDERDRRIVNISLTKKGESFLSDKKAVMIENLKSKLSGLSEEDRDRLYELLQGIGDIIGKLN